MYKLERDHDRFPIPSFSSTLLDQIYRSIDDGQSNETAQTKFFYRETTTSTSTSKKQWADRKDNNNNNNNKVVVRTKNVNAFLDNRKFHHDHDPDDLSFSSTSISSDSSSGGLSFSSSDTDSAARAAWPKPVRTSASFRWENEKQGIRVSKQGLNEEALIKSKSRALKIYNNLKKMKQPISPGGKLTSFLNTLFATGHNNAKKKKIDERRVNSGQASSTTCYSASSFSRSCLSKASSCDREKMKRTVRFEEEEDKTAREFLREYCHRNLQEDDEDAASCASSDLFELDHLGMYDDELPVFETTRFTCI